MTTTAAVAFDAALPWQKSRSVALRPEPFGALVYHFGNRKLSFLKSKQLVSVVEALADQPERPRPPSTACGVPEAPASGLREGARRPRPLGR